MLCTVAGQLRDTEAWSIQKPGFSPPRMERGFSMAFEVTAPNFRQWCFVMASAVMDLFGAISSHTSPNTDKSFIGTTEVMDEVGLPGQEP